MVTHVITVGEDVTERVEASRHVAPKSSRRHRATARSCVKSIIRWRQFQRARNRWKRATEGALAIRRKVDDLREYLALIHGNEAFRYKSVQTGCSILVGSAQGGCALLF